jgi:hypothetical protein
MILLQEFLRVRKEILTSVPSPALIETYKNQRAVGVEMKLGPKSGLP